MDIPFWLPTDNHHGSRMPVRIPAFPQPGKDVWYPPLQEDPPPPRSQWPRGTPTPNAEGRHHVPCRRKVDRGPAASPLWHTTSYKEDLQSSAAELIYGEPLRVPSEFLIPAAPNVEAYAFIQQLHRHVDQLRPTPAACHTSLASFIHKDLWDSTHVFLRQDAIRCALEPQYSGPHIVIARMDKTQLSCAAGRLPSQLTE
jgi:hypothetical protein